MKRTYNKPTLKSVNLWSAEQLMANSFVIGGEGNYAGGEEALSNEEGAHDIWGNDGSSIW